MDVFHYQPDDDLVGHIHELVCRSKNKAHDAAAVSRSRAILEIIRTGE